MKDESSFDIHTNSNPVQTVAPTTKEENEMIGATDKQHSIADCPSRTRKMTRKKAMKIRRIPFSINSSC